MNFPEGIKTPFYIYNLDKIYSNALSYKHLITNDVHVLYATMANARLEIIKSVSQAGLGVFVNSISHLQNALKAGLLTSNIVFAGSGHSEKLLEKIAALGVDFHADSLSQLRKYMSFNPCGRIGLRVNVGSLLQDSIKKDPAPRLGMTLEEISQAISVYGDKLATLHVYVGTNLLDSYMHCQCLKTLIVLAKRYPSITNIDLGGGFVFSPDDQTDNGMWNDVLKLWIELTRDGAPLQLTIEPGRSIVRTAGKFYVTVTDVKKRGDERFVIVDTSGTWFPRKIIHDIDEHILFVVGRENEDYIYPAKICGSTTFSKDFLTCTNLPEVTEGDVICFPTAGAYNEAMHMDFLGISAPAIVMCREGKQWIERENTLY